MAPVPRSASGRAERKFTLLDAVDSLGTLRMRHSEKINRVRSSGSSHCTLCDAPH